MTARGTLNNQIRHRRGDLGKVYSIQLLGGKIQHKRSVKKMKEEKGEKIRKRNKRKITTCSVSFLFRFEFVPVDESVMQKKGGSVCCTGVREREQQESMLEQSKRCRCGGDYEKIVGISACDMNRDLRASCQE